MFKKVNLFFSIIYFQFSKKNDLSERDLKMEEKVYQPNEEENKEEIKDNKSSDGESLGSADDVSDQSFGMDSSESNDILYCYYEKVKELIETII